MQRRSHLRAAAILAAAIATPALTRAASGTWTGLAADTLWQSPLNWTAVPGSTTGTTSPDVATFNLAPTSFTVTVDPNRNVAGLTFDNTSTPFVIGDNAGNTLTLSPGGTTQLTSSVSGNPLSEIVAAPLLLAGPTYTLTNNAPGGTTGITFTGSITPLVATTLTLNGSNNAGASTGTSQLTGVLADAAGGAKLSVVKNDTGNWELRGASTYSGDTVVNAGLLRFVNANSPSPNTHLIVNNGGKIRFSTNGAVSPSIEIRSGGVVDTSGSSTGYNIKADAGPALYLNYSAAAATVFYSATGAISLTGAVAGQGGIKLSATSSQAAVNLGATSTQLDLGSVLRPFDIGLTNPANTDPANLTAAGYDLRYRGPISGSGGGILKTGAGTLLLDKGALTFTGPIEVQQGTLSIATSDSLPGVNTLLVDGGTFHLAGGQSFRFAGVTATKGSITGSNSASTVRSPSFAFNVAAGDAATADAVLADLSSPATLTKTGAGTATLSAANTYTGTTTVSAGTLVIAQGAKTNFLANPAGVDLQGGKLVFDYTGGTSSSGTVASLLATSYASTPHFSAGQIRSSTADATHALGYYDDGVSALTVKYTYYGDLNLDGKVDADDYALLDRGRAGGLKGWSNGDVNYDNAVDAADYLLVDRSFGQQGGPLSPSFLNERESEFGAAYVSELLASVPEPTSLAACGLAVATLARRRRR